MLLVSHRRARFDYEILATYQAGIVLTGPEVKSLRAKHASLTGSYVQFLNGRPVLVGAQISPYPYADNRDYDPQRSRPLLLKKSEIHRLQSAVAERHATLVPLAFQLVGRRIKLEFALARGRRQTDKRALVKQREWERSKKQIIFR